MKLTLKQKKQIYNEWKLKHKMPGTIAKERKLNTVYVKYMIDLAELHGVSVLAHKSFLFSAINHMPGDDTKKPDIHSVLECPV